MHVVALFGGKPAGRISALARSSCLEIKHTIFNTMKDKKFYKRSVERDEGSVDSQDMSNGGQSYDGPRHGVLQGGHPMGVYQAYPQPYYYPYGNGYFGQQAIEYSEYQMASYQQQQQQQQQHMMIQQQQYYAALQQQQYHMMQFQQQQYYLQQQQQQPQPLHMMQAMSMEDLKQYVMQVDASDVKTVIQQALFSPRQMAFTSLMQIAGKSKQTDKAVAIFEAMKEIGTMKPNTFSYTALISALARVGDWQRAEVYFQEMKQIARTDTTVSPNRVTFSSMISVYDKANKFDMAMKTYKEQLDSNIQPDLITYASILTACQRAGSLKNAVEIVDAMHAHGLLGPLQLYHNLLGECSDDWETALEIFCRMQSAEITVNAATFNLVVKALVAGGQKDHAVSLMKQADDIGVKLGAAFYEAVLGMCSDQGDFTSADETYESMKKNGLHLSGHLAGLILSAHMQGGDGVDAIKSLNVQFESQGIIPVLPVKQEVVEHNASPAAKLSDADVVTIDTSMTQDSINTNSDVGNGMKSALLVCDKSVANVSLGSTQSEIDVGQTMSYM